MDMKGMINVASDSRRPLILMGIVILLVAIVISVLIIFLIMHKRKAARLAALVKKMEEDKKRLEEDMKLETESDKQAIIGHAIKKLDDEIKVNKETIAALNEKKDKFNKDMESVTSWDDLEISPPPSSSSDS